MIVLNLLASATIYTTCIPLGFYLVYKFFLRPDDSDQEKFYLKDPNKPRKVHFSNMVSKFGDYILLKFKFDENLPLGADLEKIQFQ